MQILDLSKIGKLVLNVLLGCLLVHAVDDDDPALNRCSVAAQAQGVSWQRRRQPQKRQWVGHAQRRAVCPSTLGTGPAASTVVLQDREVSTSASRSAPRVGAPGG